MTPTQEPGRTALLPQTPVRPSATQPDPGVALVDGLLVVDGEPRVLLCASLFYFRIPRSQWRERLEQVRASGYTSIDVYLPWNFHETAPGVWDFTGERDVAAFLDLAAEVGLLVVARPGPYICSEWDGGALPAWLTLDPDLQVRQHEPRFLEQVARWFDQVVPLLAARQLGDPLGSGTTGTVVLVQAENELDFFDCHDRTGYVGALHDLLVGHSITVPVVACSGQGDLQGATGDVAGVVSACNFYPDDTSPAVETEVLRYTAELAARGLPLLVTETNRLHVTLRRLLVSGARLLAPYLQASGYNFGATPSVGNWGDPGSFMAHDYDFAGYVTPEGTERHGFLEAQLLARVVDTLGPRLAASTPAAGPAVEVEQVGFPTSDHLAALDLAGGGRLVGLPNLSHEVGTAVVHAADGPVDVEVAGMQCALVLLDLPLAGWGRPETLALASADLVGVREGVAGLQIDLVSDAATTVVLSGCGDDATVDGRPVGPVVRLALDSTRPSALVTTAAGRIVVSLATVADATRHTAPVEAPRSLQDTSEPAGTEPESTHSTRDAAGAGGTDRRLVALQTARATPADLYGAVTPVARDDGAPTLESLGVYRGRGRYRTTVDATTAEAVLLVGAGDIVDLRLSSAGTEDHSQGGQRPGDEVVPSVARFGAAHLVDLRHREGELDLTADVEIWGHANFDDHRLPALRLGSQRGIGQAYAVESVTDVTTGWEVAAVAGGAVAGGAGLGADELTPVPPPSPAPAPGDLRGDVSVLPTPSWPGRGPRPLRTLGGWSSTRLSAPLTYARSVPVARGTRAALRLHGQTRPVHVAVDGRPPVVVHPVDPWLVLPAPDQTSGTTTTNHLAVTWPHDPSMPGMRAEILTIRPLTCWDAAPLTERSLDEQAAGQRSGTVVDLPVALAAGDDLWLDLDVPPSPSGLRLQLLGRQVRVTAWLGDRSLGRVWLGDQARPVVSGGDPESLWTPDAPDGAVLTLLVHGTAGSLSPSLDRVALSAP